MLRTALGLSCRFGELFRTRFLFLFLAKGASSFTTSRITHHLITNIWAIGLFHEFDYSVEGEAGLPGKVTISGNPNVQL